MKVCNTCNIEKHNDDFCKEKRSKDNLESKCRECKNKQKNKKRETLNGYIQNACFRKDRKDLNYLDVIKLYYKQKGKCALSGVKMTHKTGKGLVKNNISIDRIGKGKDGGEYTIDNIRLVTAQVNMSLNKWKDKEFIKMCKNVIKYNNEEI